MKKAGWVRLHFLLPGIQTRNVTNQSSFVVFPPISLRPRWFSHKRILIERLHGMSPRYTFFPFSWHKDIWPEGARHLLEANRTNVRKMGINWETVTPLQERVRLFRWYLCDWEEGWSRKSVSMEPLFWLNFTICMHGGVNFKKFVKGCKLWRWRIVASTEHLLGKWPALLEMLH